MWYCLIYNNYLIISNDQSHIRLFTSSLCRQSSFNEGGTFISIKINLKRASSVESKIWTVYNGQNNKYFKIKLINFYQIKDNDECSECCFTWKVSKWDEKLLKASQ